MEGHGTGADRGHAGYGQAMYYSLSLPVSTVIIGCDSIPQLEQNVQLARELSPRNRQQLAALTEKAQPVSKQSLFFSFYERASGKIRETLLACHPEGRAFAASLQCRRFEFQVSSFEFQNLKLETRNLKLPAFIITSYGHHDGRFPCRPRHL